MFKDFSYDFIKKKKKEKLKITPPPFEEVLLEFQESVFDVNQPSLNKRLTEQRVKNLIWS